MPCPPRKADTKFLSLQVLRAIAALSVVAYHAAEMWRTRLSPGGSVYWSNAAAGVDLFFVISGFVLVLSANRRAGAIAPGRRFLWGRLRRIVPLYWLCSLIKITGLALAGGIGRLGWSFCLASLFFLPVHDAAGFFKPVLPVGWTLSFEMMFYLLFAAALGLGLAPVLAVPPVLLAFAVLPSGGGAWGELANPIILEFAYGMALAWLWQRRWLDTIWAGPPLILAGLACLFLLPKAFMGHRFLSWGLPAAGLVAGMVCLEPILAPFVPRLLVALGDASYSIYLTHGFVLAGLAIFPHGTQVSGSAAAIAVCAMAASAGFGWLVHILVEIRLFVGSPRDAAAPPRVLVLVGGGFAPLSGGVGVLLHNLIDAWAGMPLAPRVRMLDTRGGGSKAAGVLRFASALLQVIVLCGARRADLVHAHMTTRGSALRKCLLCAVAILLRVPVVMHMHGADFIAFYNRLPRWARALLGMVLRRADHVVVLGAAWRGFLVTAIGVLPSRIMILPNGVPRPLATPKEASSRTPNILFLGRLCERKGLPELIAALATPSLRARDWEAVLAGDGDPAPFRAMLLWHRLDGRVQVPGWLGRQETALHLAHADILVLPSHDEAMPIAVLEALAAGVAVITTPVGTITEFLSDKVNALLVLPGDIASLATAIESLLDDAALRARLAAAGHRVFLEKLEIGGVAARLAHLYRASIATQSWALAEAAE